MESTPQEFMINEIEEMMRLQNSDLLGMKLVATPLTCTNFLQWSRSIMRALGAPSKLPFLDG